MFLSQDRFARGMIPGACQTLAKRTLRVSLAIKMTLAFVQTHQRRNCATKPPTLAPRPLVSKTPPAWALLEISALPASALRGITVEEPPGSVTPTRVSMVAPAKVGWQDPPACAVPATPARCVRGMWMSASPSRAATGPCAGTAWINIPATACQDTRASTAIWRWTSVPQSPA